MPPGRPALTVAPAEYYREPFTAEETAILERFFTNATEPVFALINLPEVVKGALFARYSRTSKSVRRLFLDDFYGAPEAAIQQVADRLQGESELIRLRRAEDLYQRVFTEFGDDSVAQLGGVHLACEQASNLLTKVLEWGRLGSYLEQSTRYILFDQPLGGRYRYFIPPEVAASSLRAIYCETMDLLFSTYARLVAPLIAMYEGLYPNERSDDGFAYRSAIRSKACDDLRGLLPASTLSNVGIYASGQSCEALLLRMRSHPLAEARHYSGLILAELRKVIPSFVSRVDLPDRGVAWSDYLEETAGQIELLASGLGLVAEDRPEVTLVDWDPDAESRVAAAALYSVSSLPEDQLLRHVSNLPPSERARILATYAGRRANRRHKPGRAFERAWYRFDLLCDYGIFRDLQRHRMLTIEWQQLGPNHGFVVPPAIEEVGAAGSWREAMEAAAHLHQLLAVELGSRVAQYAIPLAYRVRFCLQMNAREATHLLELRTQQSGHPSYRRVCQEMHRLIREKAGHTAIADAMCFVDHGSYQLERLESERRAAARREAAGLTDPAD
jgi:thymidylate synthase ThyX